MYISNGNMDKWACVWGYSLVYSKGNRTMDASHVDYKLNKTSHILSCHQYTSGGKQGFLFCKSDKFSLTSHHQNIRQGPFSP